MPLEIKKLSIQDIDKYIELFNKTPFLSAYNPFLKGDTEFKWQFFSNNGVDSVYYIAYDEEELVGTLAALVISMVDPNGNICYTIKPEDALINLKSIIKYKNRDIFKELFDKIVRDTNAKQIKFHWGFTEAVDAFRRLNFKNCFKSYQGIYAIKPLRAYNHLKSLNPSNKLKQKVLILGLSFASYVKGINFSKSSKIKFQEINFDKLNLTDIKSFLPKSLYSIELSKQFINWRIINNTSELEYGLFQFTDKNNQTLAYLIFSKKEGNVFFIDQFLFNQNLDLNRKKQIVNIALKQLKKRNAAIVRVMGFDHNSANKEEMQILNSKGFIFVKKGIPFILKTNDNQIKYEQIYLSRLNTQGTF